ncbi:hypothetical protein AVEN_81209-1 [Araneus ventricosus]|uniref:Uncharacterized protein n=1 Tax=Araneus ventricosus TaxID=182803 RepID=A0A4Y2LIU9_ARAVE|nr:hypothetical protein AVEN_81209-1 [Araneus ventricosus]
MKQINKILNCNDKYLDLILSNIVSCVIAIRHSGRPEDFHHPALSIFMKFVPARTNKSTDPVLKYDFKRVDFPSLWYSIREIDWNQDRPESGANAQGLALLKGPVLLTDFTK